MPSSQVFVFSFSGRKARVVQVHFDGKLVVRLTKYLDFTEENMDNIKLLLRWMMNEPIGDTTFGSSTTIDLINSPTTPAKEMLGDGATHILVK